MSLENGKEPGLGQPGSTGTGRRSVAAKVLSQQSESLMTPPIPTELRSTGNEPFSWPVMPQNDEQHLDPDAQNNISISSDSPTQQNFNDFSDNTIIVTFEQPEEPAAKEEEETPALLDGILPSNTCDQTWTGLENCAVVFEEPARPEEPSMTAVNPCQVEGIHLVPVAQLVKQEPSPEDASAPPAKRMKPGLKLIMPEPASAPETGPVLDTPAIEHALEQNVEDADFDLLDFVVNSELPVNDPSFMELIGETPTAQETSQLLTTINPADLLPAHEPRPSTSKAAAKPPKGKRLISKAKKTPAPEQQQQEQQPQRESKRPRGRPPTDHAYQESDLVDEPGSDEDHKYRRMRDLNNIASKRCRQNRKRKFQALQDEESQLVERNVELKAKCRQMEDVVKRLKERFIEKVANPQKEPLDLDKLMAQRLEAY